jgi:hypothetical protein
MLWPGQASLKNVMARTSFAEKKQKKQMQKRKRKKKKSD